MLAFTFVQPYATAILTLPVPAAHNRIPPKKLLGERFAVHAALKEDYVDKRGLRASIERELARLENPLQIHKLPTSAIVGTVRLRGFLEFCCGEWIANGLSVEEVEGTLHSPWRGVATHSLWVLDQPVLLAEPIPMRGSSGFWIVPERFKPLPEPRERYAAVSG